MSKRYFIQDTTARGDLALWWGPNRSGYTVRLDEAGRYDEEEAQAIAKIRGTDVPRLVEEVEVMAVRVVAAERVVQRYGRHRKRA